MTKKDLGNVWSYNHARHTSVKSVYAKPSSLKVSAENDILREMDACNGYGYRVCGHNCMMFSCGYLYRAADGLTHLVYHTKSARRECIYDPTI